MKPFCLCSFWGGILLALQICSADVTEDLDNVYPFPFETSFEKSNTEDSIKMLFSTFEHYGQLSGACHGHSILNGYAQIIGAMAEYRDSKEQWFKQPFAWLKDNQLMVPELLKRNGYKLSAEHILFVNYLLSSYKTITGKPDWKINFRKIKLLYSQFNNEWEDDTIDYWAQKNNFIITPGLDDKKEVIPDYVAWGLAENWIGAHAYPSVFNSTNNKEVLWNSHISFENYMASFWYRRWADSSMNTVYRTLKLISAFIPRNFEKQKSNGFVDFIPAELSRTGENWELHPTPSVKITCLRVKEDGKTRVDSIWTAIVPTAVKIVDLMPPVTDYYMLEDSLLTPGNEGIKDTFIIKMAPIESSSLPSDSKEESTTKVPAILNSEIDLKKFTGSDPVATINNLTKVYDPCARFFAYNKEKNLLKFATPDIKVELSLSDVNLQIIKGNGQEFYIQFLCKDGSKCVKCSYTGPTSVTAITVKKKEVAERIIAELEKLQK
jgi:hypothetical protein